MEKRVFLIVLDSFGIGAEPDAAAFGDEGTNTLGAIAKHPNFNCPNLKKLGLFNIDGVTAGEKDAAPTGSFARLHKQPKSDLGVPPFYLYKRDTLPLIDEYLKEGNNPDAPGHFIPWLIGKNDVYAYVFDAVRIDIGTPESYYDACEKQKNGTLFNN